MKKLAVILLCLGLITLPTSITLCADILSKIEKEFYGRWILFPNHPALSSGATDAGLAVMYDESDKRWIITASISPSADENKKVFVTLPNGVKETLHIVSCLSNSCQAFIPENDQILIDQFKKQSVCTVSFTDKKGKEISVPLSLDGFSAGFVALQSAYEAKQKRGRLK